MIAALHVIVNEIKRHFGLEKVRLLDMPCGDMRYMSRFLSTRSDIAYTGIDIVSDIITHHRKTFQDHPWVFRHADIVADDFDNNFDLIISRHMLQHLENAAIFSIFRKISVETRHPSFLLVTTFSNSQPNLELNMKMRGRYRPVNVEIAPFRLEPPLCMFRDGPIRGDRLTSFMGLWRLPLMTIPESICKSTEFPTVLAPRPLYSCVDWKSEINFRYNNN